MKPKNELFMDAIEWLIDNGLAENQGDIAVKAGLGPNLISRIKNGHVKSVSDDAIRALCSRFEELNIDYLRGKSSSSASQAVTLGRVATRLQITVTDEVPANAAVFTVTPSQWYYGINYTTGAGVGLQANYPRPVNIPANYIGTSGELMISFFGFVPSADWQTDVTATLTASDESVLGQVTLEDVTLNKNITTAYSGGILGTAKAFSLTADDTWGEDDVHTW